MHWKIFRWVVGTWQGWDGTRVVTLAMATRWHSLLFYEVNWNWKIILMTFPSLAALLSCYFDSFQCSQWWKYHHNMYSGCHIGALLILRDHSGYHSQHVDNIVWHICVTGPPRVNASYGYKTNMTQSHIHYSLNSHTMTHYKVIQPWNVIPQHSVIVMIMVYIFDLILLVVL